ASGFIHNPTGNYNDVATRAAAMFVDYGAGKTTGALIQDNTVRAGVNVVSDNVIDAQKEKNLKQF
ncbi:MAG: hypothetical protein ACK5SB_03875, partial [Flavobacterium sp.]